MNQDYYQKRAVEIIKLIKYATLATVTPDGKPWNSPVAHEYDSDLNIYWVSDKNGQHSINVSDNSRVFIVIYDSTVPEGKGEGVYIQANVQKVADPDEILRVRRIKKGKGYVGNLGEYLTDGVRHMYKAIPEKIWMNDAEITDGVFIRDYRVTIPLEAIKAGLK